MFCVFIQIDGFRQLERIRPATSRDLATSVDQVLSRSGATGFRREAGLFLYLFPRSSETDHRQVLDASFGLRTELVRHEDDLTDFSVVIEYLGSEDADELFRSLRNALGRLTEERSIWIGPRAAASLAAEVEVSQHGEFLRIEDPVRASSRRLVDGADFMRNQAFITATLDRIEAWLNGNEQPGILLLSCKDRAYARENARHLLRDVYGAAGDGRWVTLYPSEREDESLAPIANSVVPHLLPRVPALLQQHELRLWQSVQGSVLHLMASPTLFGLFDGADTDVLTAYTLYLKAVLRSLQRDLLPAVIVLENIDLFPLEAVRMLRKVYDRLEGELTPLLVATSARPAIPLGIADLTAIYSELPLFGADDVADHAVRFLSDSAGRHIRIADCCRRTRGLPLELYFHFVNVQDSLEHAASNRIDVKQQDRHGEAAAMLERLNQDEREILAIAALIAGHTVGSLVIAVAVRVGYDHLRVRQVVRRLVGLGLMRDVDSMYVDILRVRKAALSSCGSASARIEAAVAQTLLSIVGEGGARLTPSLLRVVVNRSGGWVPALRDLLRHALDARRFERAAKVLADAAGLKARAEKPELVAQILAAAELRYALLLEDQARADRLYEARRAFHGHDALEQSVEADATLEYARYVTAKGNRTQAQALCKRAIMLYQEGGDSQGVGRANLEFGWLMLAQEKVGEARDYFVMARPQSGAAQEGYTEFRARAAELVCLFLTGDLTRVAEQIEPLRVRCADLGLREAELLLQLLQGRVSFELGYYQAALETFQQALCDAAVYRFGEAQRVLRGWSARCLIYLDDPNCALAALAELPATEEVRFFRAEAYERKQEPEHALAEICTEVAQRAVRFRSPEQIAWESGFSAIEDRAIGVSGGDSVLGHLGTSFRAYLVAMTGEPDQGIAEFHHLTRKEKISAVDPYNRLYYYLYSRILPYSRSSDCEDPLTILGKSVKYMRERSSRIDQYSDKRSFLSSNYWNRLLLDSARSHNLL